MSDQNQIVLHVGAPKCGSSSLQAALSARPNFLAADGTDYAYVIPQNDGRLRQGNDVTERARRSVFGYGSAPDVRPNCDLPPWMDTCVSALKTVSAEGKVPIMSAEGWINRAWRFTDSKLLERADLKAHVIVFVRPPLEWLNSAWWQWGTWTEADLEPYIRGHVEAARWNKHIANWMGVPGVQKVTVKLVDGDVVQDFFLILGAEVPSFARINSGINPALLYFMLRNREFRPTPHTPHVEFALARQMQSFSPTPWVIGPDMSEFVINHLMQANRNLMDKFSPEDQQRLKDDPRWWTLAAYQDRPIASQQQFSALPELETLAAELQRALEPGRRPAAKDGGPFGFTSLAEADHSLKEMVMTLLDQDEAHRAG